MSPAPVTLAPENLGARSLHTMQTHKISATFVVQEGAPIGLVTVIQLLQHGVA